MPANAAYLNVHRTKKVQRTQLTGVSSFLRAAPAVPRMGERAWPPLILTPLRGTPVRINPLGMPTGLTPTPFGKRLCRLGTTWIQVG